MGPNQRSRREVEHEADALFDRARVLVHADDLASALPLLERTHGLRPMDVETLLYVRWVAIRASKAIAHEDLEGVVMLAREAVADGRAIGFATYVLARAALERGDAKMALALFRRASDRDPTIVDARRHLRLMTKRASDAPLRSR